MVANSETAAPLAECFELIRERLGAELHSLWFNANCEAWPTPSLGPTWTKNWCGPPAVIERFGGAAVHYPPGAFGQNNLEIAQAIIEHVRSQIPQDARATEFYAGVGAIGLSVLARVRAIHMNEINPHSLHGLDLDIAGSRSSEREKISVVPGAAAASRFAVSGAQVVIADPPRKGLDPEPHRASHRAPTSSVSIYVGSRCRIAAQRHRSPDYRVANCGLGSLTAFNLLPFTEHVETVACFERVDTVHGNTWRTLV